MWGRGAAGTALARIAAAGISRLPPRATASWIRAMTAGPVNTSAFVLAFHRCTRITLDASESARPGQMHPLPQRPASGGRDRDSVSASAAPLARWKAFDSGYRVRRP